MVQKQQYPTLSLHKIIQRYPGTLRVAGHELKSDRTKELLHVIFHGIDCGLTGLSRMIDYPVSIEFADIELMSPDGFFRHYQDTVQCTTVVQMNIYSDACSSIVLTIRPDSACTIIDSLLGFLPGTTNSFDEMGRSVLGELGNIAGSYFLNELADRKGLQLSPTPPLIITDLSSASLLPSVKVNNPILVIDTHFSVSSWDITGSLLVYLSDALIGKLAGFPEIRPG